MNESCAWSDFQDFAHCEKNGCQPFVCGVFLGIFSHFQHAWLEFRTGQKLTAWVPKFFNSHVNKMASMVCTELDVSKGDINFDFHVMCLVSG